MSFFDLAVRLNKFPEAVAQWQVKHPDALLQTAEQEEYEWIKRTFSRAWANQAFKNKRSCAVVKVLGRTAGFVSWNVPKLGFFGPLGVAEEFRGRDLGTGLTLASLAELELCGYGWAIIHRIGPLEFYKKFLKVVELPRY